MFTGHLQLQNLLQTLCSGIAVWTNCILFLLIVYKSPTNLGAYKYLMIYISVFEIFYAIFDATALPNLYSNGSGFLVVLNSNRSILPRKSLQFLNYVFCGSFGVSMAIFAVHFVFRYLVVSGRKEWTRQSRIFVWILIPSVSGVVWAVSCAIFIGPNATSDVYLRSEVLRAYHATFSDLSYVGPVFDSNATNIEAFSGLMIMTSILFFSFSTMLYFGLKCHSEVRALARKSTCSFRYKTLQAELFYGLVAQSLIPVTLLHMPATLVFFSTFLGKSRLIYGELLVLTNAIYPVLDPLPNMLIIKSYRKAIISLPTYIFKRRGSRVSAMSNYKLPRSGSA